MTHVLFRSLFRIQGHRSFALSCSPYATDIQNFASVLVRPPFALTTLLQRSFSAESSKPPHTPADLIRPLNTKREDVPDEPEFIQHKIIHGSSFAEYKTKIMIDDPSDKPLLPLDFSYEDPVWSNSPTKATPSWLPEDPIFALEHIESISTGDLQRIAFTYKQVREHAKAALEDAVKMKNETLVPSSPSPATVSTASLSAHSLLTEPTPIRGSENPLLTEDDMPVKSLPLISSDILKAFRKDYAINDLENSIISVWEDFDPNQGRTSGDDNKDRIWSFVDERTMIIQKPIPPALLSRMANLGIRPPGMKKKLCPLRNKNRKPFIDYRMVAVLSQFLTEGGKILPKRVTGVSMVAQKRLDKAVKKARRMALLNPCKNMDPRKFNRPSILVEL